MGPTTAGELIDLLAETLRLKANWQEADRAALRRWVRRGVLGPKVKERLVRNVADGALRPSVLANVDEQRRLQLVEALGAGLLSGAERWEHGDRAIWWQGLVATVAVVLNHLNLPALRLSHGGAAAQAPDWFFAHAGSRPATRKVAEAVRAVGSEAEAGGDGRLRKNAAALASGAASHRDTIDELQVIAAKHAKATGKPTPALSVALLLQELTVHLQVDFLFRTLLLSRIEAMRNALRPMDFEQLLAALRGECFAAVEILSNTETPQYN